MRRILLAPDGSEPGGSEIVLETVDETTVESLEDVSARYHIVIPADHLAEAPALTEGIRVAFLCTELESFDRLRKLQVPGDLLFKPSAVARLDMLRRARRTLVVAHGLRAGQSIAEPDLDEAIGGSGIDVAFRGDIIGRQVLYDLAAGAPIDFGVIDEDRLTGNAVEGDG